jgi:hypothetical protein
MSDGTTERAHLDCSGQLTIIPRAGPAVANGAFKALDPGDLAGRKIIQVRNSADTTDRFVVFGSGAAAVTSTDPATPALDLKGAPAQSAFFLRIVDSADNNLVYIENDGELNAQRRMDVFNDTEPANTVLNVRGHTTQTASLQAWQTGAGATVARVRADGTGDFTPTVTSSGISTAASGWSIASQVAVDKAGTATINITFLRTGADIVAGASGNITDTPVGTLNAAFRPNANFGAQSLTFAGTTGVGTGSVRVTPTTGDITLVTWSSSGTLQTGEGLQLTMTWPLDF